MVFELQTGVEVQASVYFIAINIKHLARRPSRSMFCAVRTLVRKQGLSTHYNNYVNLL